jgi:hypothetical protein
VSESTETGDRADHPQITVGARADDRHADFVVSYTNVAVISEVFNH